MQSRQNFYRSTAQDFHLKAFFRLGKGTSPEPLKRAEFARDGIAKAPRFAPVLTGEIVLGWGSRQAVVLRVMERLWGV